MQAMTALAELAAASPDGLPAAALGPLLAALHAAPARTDSVGGGEQRALLVALLTACGPQALEAASGGAAR